MTFIQKTFFTLALALVPVSAFAAPSNVVNVEARIENGILSVSWEGSRDDAGIDFYRVYFSHESILDHEGNYDDSVRTDGDGTTYEFRDLPLQSEKIYVAILAVNKDGVESDGFESEAAVDVPRAEPAVEEHGANTQEPMTLDDLHADSATGVFLGFHKKVSTTTQFTPEYFVITDLSGVVLRIDSLEVIDTMIILHTEQQDPAKEYLLSIVQPVPAEDGTNYPVSDTPLRWMAFGHQDNAAPAEEVQPEEQPVEEAAPPEEPAPEDIPYGTDPALGDRGPPEDAVDLALKAMRRADGTYTVVATWGASADTARTLQSYVLYTTKNGDNFDRNTAVSVDRTVAQFSHLNPGVFGVRVTAKDANGNESGGIQEVITLPESGIGLLGITALSGLIAAKRTRRKKSC